MTVTKLDESTIQAIGHAVGFYDYGPERGLADAFPSRDATATYICGYVRMALQSGLLHTTGPRGEGYIAYRLPGEKVSLDTDAKSKCDKYIHLGMHFAGTRHFGPHGVLYDLIKYPDWLFPLGATREKRIDFQLAIW